MFDYLIVGSGLYGAVFANKAISHGKKVLVVEKREHIGGNVYSYDCNGIQVHKYGPHTFHTNSDEVWKYMNQFADFNRFTCFTVARYKNEVYNLPFNMNTFSKMWGITTPAEAEAIIEKQRAEISGEPKNLEEQAIKLVGRDIYEKLVKGYTEKQWGRPCTELPTFIIKRLPVRFVYDNNYFNDKYQGIPIGGYTQMIKKMLDGAEIRLNTDFLADKDNLSKLAEKIVYTGPIDAYFNYCYGELEFRSLRFETEDLPIENYQGDAVVNYTEFEVPYTRIIEHKHFEFGCQGGEKTEHTVITREYPKVWQKGDEPYYPINDDKNNALYVKYKALADAEKNVIFGGRLGEYKYYDMDKVVAAALETCSKIGL